MARPLRIEFAGALYHLTTRGNAKRAIFRDNQDRLLLLDVLKKVADRYNWLCHAYCLMDNHYHLVIETPEGNLSKGMRQLNGIYTQAYNRRHRRVGHLFQGRYKAILVDKESHFLEVCRYVVLNPVRAQVVKEAESWKWSSYGGTSGRAKAHGVLASDWVLEQFGREKRAAQKRYREFVREGVEAERIHENVVAQSLLGREDFVQKLVGHVRGHEKVKEIPRGQRYLARPSLAELFKAAVKGKETRDRKISEAVEKHGYSQKEVADHLGMHYSTISKLVGLPRSKT
jgi:REP element-mobilizing transposase RayT